jgi:nucleoporin GLE1
MVLEFSQLLIRSEEEFTSRLDQACAEHAQIHHEQLSKAALEHKKVRDGAELERKRLIAEQELQRQRREEEQRRELERIEQEKAKHEAEARQRQVEAKQREEAAARQAAEQKRQIQEAEDRLKAQKDREEAARKQQRLKQEEAARRSKEEAAAAEKARTDAPKLPPQLPQAQQTPQAPQAPQSSSAPAIPNPTTQTTTTRNAPGATDVEEIHSRYLALHQRMKAFWKPFSKECAKKDNPLKGPVGDLRRDIRKVTGQVTVKREDSKAVITKLREILRRSLNAGGPTIDIRPFIISHPLPALSSESEAQYPAILLYAYICFEKFVIKQFDQEAANEEGRIISEVGAIAASLFVDKEFVWKGIPLIDLLLAKFHRTCPVLFGISGDMKTAEGRARLGLLPVGGEQISANYYHQRMLGLGLGYAAISLRAVATPAVPISEYWRALASICNIASQDLYSGHFMVLKGLVRDSAKKVVSFYGAQGKAILRHATIVLPRRAPERVSQEASLVRVLPEVWKAVGLVLE